MKLAVWAQEQGIPYKTAWRWFSEGVLPVPAIQTPTGTILVQKPSSTGTEVAIYGRVASADQKPDLDRQVARLAEHASSQGLPVVLTVTEIGSGLNGHRQKLLKLLSDPKVGTILVEHRDRLARFGTEYVEAALAAQGRRIVVVDPKEVEDDLVQDMLDVLTSFCARLYGRRASKNRARRALEAAKAP